MAHKAQLDFIQAVSKALPEFFKGTRVLEVGSLDINGSVRQFFERCDYTGIDIGPGPGVDQVCLGHEYSAPDGSLDLALSCECLEHNPYWQETVSNMIRLVRPGGLVILTCATTGRLEHGTARTSPTDSPLTTDKGWNYYRNLAPRDFKGGLSGLTHIQCWQLWDSFDFLLIGIREGDTPKNWAGAVEQISAAVERSRGRNDGVRRLVARWGGDAAFDALRRIAQFSWRLGKLFHPITEQRH
jgi:SAM-dependent methyltransferase